MNTPITLGAPSVGIQAASVLSNTDSPVQGILLVAVGISIFSIQDVIIRQFSGSYSVLEIMFIRGLVAVLPMVLFVHFQGGFSTLRCAHPFLTFLRGFLGVMSYTSFYMAMAVFPLATVTSILFTSPLIVTVLSVMILGDKVGPRRWLGIMIGFSGMLLIAQPGSTDVGWNILLPAMAAVFYASSIIVTRKLGKTQSGASMALYAMLTFIVASGLAGVLFGDGSLAIDTDSGSAEDPNMAVAFLLRGWQIPTTGDFGLMAICGAVAAVGFYCLSQGYRVAQPSVAAPFEYVALPLSVIWGYVIWGEIPAPTTFVGIAMIVGGGLYILQRERTRGQKITTGRKIRWRL